MSNGITRKSLLRQPAWFGADRRVVGISGFALGLLGMTLFRAFGIWYGLSIIIPGVIWLAVVWVGREMHKADPHMVDVLMRQFQYRKYYAPKGHLGVEHPQIKDFR